MSLVAIELGEKGVERVIAKPTTISDANRASALMAKTAFSIRLLHDSIKENSSHISGCNYNCADTQIFVPRITDEEIGVTDFQQLSLGVGKPVESIDFRKLPQWLIDAMKRAHPRESWATAAEDYPVGGESELAWMRLTNHYRFLDHEGFIEDERGTVLVSEPYGLSQEKLDSLNLFLTDTGLNVNICGTSNHYPSRTIRIEIWSA